MFKIDDVKDQRSLLGHSLLAWAPLLKNTIQLVSNKIHSKKLDFMVFGKMSSYIPLCTLVGRLAKH